MSILVTSKMPKRKLSHADSRFKPSGKTPLVYLDSIAQNWGTKPLNLLAKLRKRFPKKTKLARPSSHSSSMKKGIIVAEGTGGQYSKFSLKNTNFLEKSVDKTIAPFKSVWNNAGQLKSTVGLQTYGKVLTLWDGTDVTQIDTDINGASTASRFVLESGTAEVMFSNIYLSNVTVDIYDVIARKDISGAAVADTTTAWTNGATAESAAGEGTKLGSTPFQSEYFNQYWKVMQKTHIVLGAGQMHKHCVDIDAHKLMSYAYTQNTAYGYKDLTYNCLVVISGAPANDSTTQTSVSLGAGGINYVYGKEYHSKMLYLNFAKIVDHSSLATTFAVGEQVVNVGGSTIVANAEG